MADFRPFRENISTVNEGLEMMVDQRWPVQSRDRSSVTIKLAAESTS